MKTMPMSGVRGGVLVRAAALALLLALSGGVRAAEDPPEETAAIAP
jgi:hypothetical protein